MSRFSAIRRFTLLVITATMSVMASHAHQSNRTHQPKKALIGKALIAPIMASLYALPPTQPVFPNPDPSPWDYSTGPWNFNPRLWVFRCAPYVSAAIRLQAMGKEEASQSLLRLAAWEDNQPEQNGNGYRAIVLCRMLFVPKDNKSFRRASIGPSDFLGGTTYSDWPLEPITLIDQVPFLIIKATGSADFAETSVGYVHYCMENCDWTSTHYQPLSQPQEQQALQQLLALPLWKDRLSPEEKQFFAQQIESG
jgi:hypothetical protein